MKLEEAEAKSEEVYLKVQKIWNYIDELDKRYIDQNIPYHRREVNQIIKQINSMLPLMEKVPRVQKFAKSIKSTTMDLEDLVYSDSYNVYMSLNIVKDLLHHAEFRLEENLRILRGEHIPYEIKYDAQAKINELPELTVRTFPKFSKGKRKDGEKAMSEYQRVADEREWFFIRLIKIFCGKDLSDAFWVYLHDKSEMTLTLAHWMLAEGRFDDGSRFAKAFKMDLISKDLLLEHWALMFKVAGLAHLDSDEEIDVLYNKLSKTAKKIKKLIEKAKDEED